MYGRIKMFCQDFEGCCHDCERCWFFKYPNAFRNMQSAIAEQYDPAKTYYLGDFVFENGIFFKAIENKISGKFDPSKWAKTDIVSQFNFAGNFSYSVLSWDYLKNSLSDPELVIFRDKSGKTHSITDLKSGDTVFCIDQIAYSFRVLSVENAPEGFVPEHFDDVELTFKKNDEPIAYLLQIESFKNPMVNFGDMIFGGSNGQPSKLSAGQPGQILQMDGGFPNWSNPTHLYRHHLTLNLPESGFSLPTGTVSTDIYNQNEVPYYNFESFNDLVLYAERCNPDDLDGYHIVMISIKIFGNYGYVQGYLRSTFQEFGAEISENLLNYYIQQTSNFDSVTQIF